MNTLFLLFLFCVTRTDIQPQKRGLLTVADRDSISCNYFDGNLLRQKPAKVYSYYFFPQKALGELPLCFFHFIGLKEE